MQFWYLGFGVGFKSFLKTTVSLGLHPKRWMGVDGVVSRIFSYLGDIPGIDSKKNEDERSGNAKKSKKNMLKPSQMSQAEISSRKKISVFLIILYFCFTIFFLYYSYLLTFKRNFIMQGFASFFIMLLIFTHCLREIFIYAHLICKKDKLTISEIIKTISGAIFGIIKNKK